MKNAIIENTTDKSLPDNSFNGFYTPVNDSGIILANSMLLPQIQKRLLLLNLKKGTKNPKQGKLTA